MKKISDNGIIIMILSTVLIAGIVAAPFVIERIDEKRMLASTYKTKKVEFSLDSDVENIKIITRIHKLLGSVYGSESQYVNVENLFILASDDSKNKSEYIDQIKAMSEYDGLSKILASCVKNYDKGIVVSEIFDSDEDFVKIIYSYDEGNIEFVYDTTTKKVLEFKMSEDKLKVISIDEKKKILDSMLEYLNVGIVGDWQYDGEEYVSDKAHLRVLCDSKKGVLKVHMNMEQVYSAN